MKTMEVWIVMICMEHERSEIAGAFSTEEKADEAIEILQKMDVIGDWFEVEHWELDSPIETSRFISSKEVDKKGKKLPTGKIFRTWKEIKNES